MMSTQTDAEKQKQLENAATPKGEAGVTQAKSNRIGIWIALSIFFTAAVAWPLKLFGASDGETMVAGGVCATIVSFAKENGRAEKVMIALFAYGLIFSIWCAGGFLLVIPIGLIFSDFKYPFPVYLMVASGIFGVLRELNDKNP